MVEGLRGRRMNQDGVMADRSSFIVADKTVQIDWGHAPHTPSDPPVKTSVVGFDPALGLSYVKLGARSLNALSLLPRLPLSCAKALA
jgi:hypothetical protein